jgi:nicotinamidase-related amidase
MTALELDPGRSALLLMDFQRGILERYGDDTGLLERTARVLAAARKCGMPAIFVRVGFRPGYPEVSERNMGFATLRASGRFQLDAPATAIHVALAPRTDEAVVTKHRVGAFSDTELETILRARNVDTLLLCGVATSGVVLSTLRVAADRDYRCIVVADCCTDGDAEVHAVLTGKVFPRQATVVDAATVLKALPARDP